MADHGPLAHERALNRRAPRARVGAGREIEGLERLFRRREVAVDVAVDPARAQLPVIRIGREQGIGVEAVLRIGACEREAVVGGVGPRIGLPRIGEHRHRKRLGPLEMVVGDRHRDVELVAFLPSIETRVEAADAGRRVVAPAILVDRFESGEAGESAVVDTRVGRRLDPAERSRGNRGSGTRVAKAVLHVDRQRAPQRVEPEDRVRTGQELHRGHRVLRQQIPVDDVRERFVDAHAVLEDRQSLRSSKERRCRESAEAHVGLV